MDIRANPKNLVGERNIFCPQYCGCLDHAVKNAWYSWDCSCCDLRRLQCELPPVDSPEFRDGIPFYELTPGAAKIYYRHFSR